LTASGATPGVIGAKRFTAADQEAFAQLSGDRNPIHMDAMGARRTQAGAAVVHGVHGLLWALDQAARARPLANLRGLSVKFLRYLYLDVEAQVRVSDRGEALLMEIVADGQVVTTAKLDWRAPGLARLSAALTGGPCHAFGRSPDAPPFETMSSLSGRLPVTGGDQARTLFPALSAALGAEGVAGIALVSGVVGMSCPGLHSLFSQLTLERVETPPGPPGLDWRTARTEARTRWVVLDVGGAGWEGQVIAFARPEPVQPLSMAELSRRVGPDEFSGRTALIVGGSRGLGAVTGKLLAAGGARVILTYARGAEDAEAIAGEIRAARAPDACGLARCDVTGDVAGQLADLPEGIDHLYYFATPQISRQKAGLYDREVLDAFLAVYVDGFSAVWDRLAGYRPLSVLYPSTVFVEERPKGLTEYAMAKAAAEALCADLARRAPGVSMTVPRIPRTLTDQTATSPPVPAADPVEVMLPLLRAQVRP
jgi:NAD(P)-dependent dehydrogenase (short-subunit alcohol dehydrogenase family)/acyl dehydratase